MLVTAPTGTWVVSADGSRRRLGPYREAVWSPRGLFVAAVSDSGLYAVTPGGEVRWALGRKGVAGPAWSPSGFRIAYLAFGELRVVAGDGTGDHALGRIGATRAAWLAATPRHVLAASDRRGRVYLVDADSERRIWRTAAGDPPRELVWSADGRRLAAIGRTTIRVFDRRGRLVLQRRLPPGVETGDAAFARRGHALAYVRRGSAGDQVVQLRADRRPGREHLVFPGAGRLGDLAWSPDGRWLVIGWPSADQWVFTRAAPARRVRAIDGIAKQFDPKRGPGGAAPRIGEWCCRR